MPYVLAFFCVAVVSEKKWRIYWAIALVSALAVYLRDRKLPKLLTLTFGVTFVSYFFHHTNTVKQLTHLPLLMGFVLLYHVGAQDEPFKRTMPRPRRLKLDREH
ncbi:MAG: hypothetical protein A2036_01145 [Omnitrophica bacterium GWA2_50_21]|nr:MAG: hypothetical protein A2036_01145 [Omnitrophica bacterium GWA2_50_21]